MDPCLKANLIVARGEYRYRFQGVGMYGFGYIAAVDFFLRSLISDFRGSDLWVFSDLRPSSARPLGCSVGWSSEVADLRPLTSDLRRLDLRQSVADI